MQREREMDAFVRWNTIIRLGYICRVVMEWLMAVEHVEQLVRGCGYACPCASLELAGLLFSPFLHALSATP